MTALQESLSHTNSPSLARAGRRVGCGSLWLSIPSNTKTNLRITGTWSFSSLPSSMTNCARFSQRPTVPVHPTAFATAPTVCSSRCLPVMHSAHLTIVNCRISSAVLSSECPFGAVDAGRAVNASRKAFITEVLPVASRPYKTKFL